MKLQTKNQQHWCKKHPTGFWVGDYKQCRIGYLRKEECERGDKEVQDER